MKVKIKKILAILILIFVLLGQVFFSEASSQRYKIIYTRGEQMVEYYGSGIPTPYITYQNEDGTEEGVAYCIDPDLSGVENTNNDYYVDIINNQTVTDAKLWRVITNGYPYKQPSEMRCDSKEEAYAATLLAIRYLYSEENDYDIDEFTYLNQKGENIIEAMKRIINKAEEGGIEEKPTSPVVKLDYITENWEIDELDNNYISRVFAIKNEEAIGEYKIEFQGSYLEGMKITNTKNEEKQIFNKGDYFKVLIPRDKITKPGHFYIKATANLKTFPVYIGTPENNTLDMKWQRYGILKTDTQQVTGITYIDYSKGKSKLTIIKIDEDTNEKLSNATFDLLDENKKVVHSGLATNQYGKIELDDITPGIYYLQEIDAPTGYQKVNEAIKFELKYNQDLTIKVNNKKVNKTENIKNIGTINVSTDYEENINDTEIYTEDIIFTQKNNIENETIENKTNKNTNIINQKNKTRNIENIHSKTIENDEIKYYNENDLDNTTLSDIIDVEDIFSDKQIITSSLNGKILPKTGM